MKFNFLKLLAPLLLFSWGDFGVLEAMKLGNFYPFGESEGDKVVTPNDDGSSGEVSISFPFPFFGQEHDSLFINTNGVISFLTNVYQYTPDRFPLGDRRRLVAPFWADVDARVAGEVFYRETWDPSLLKRATSDVTTIYVRCKSFRAAWLLIATWYEVAFYGARGNYSSKRNTFQAVLVTNGRNSFVIFNYDKLTWTTGTASSGNSAGLGGTPAQAGFNGGDGLRYFNIPGSGTQQVLDLSRQSNVGNPGRWLYRIDSRAGDCDHNDPPTPFDEDFLGKPTVTYVTLDPGTAAVTLKCEVPINRNVRLWKNVTYQIVWYSKDEHLKTDDFCGTLPPDIKEYDSPCPGKPLVSFLKGMDYSLNSLISCNVTARYTTSPLNTWCVPKSVQEPFFAGLKVSPNRLEVKECSLDIITFTITPTIPVSASELQKDKYLKISFWSSDGIEIDSDDCEVELKDLQPITVRVIARCTTTEQSPTVDKSIIPTIESGHSSFWNRDSHLSSVAVSVETNSENIHTCKTYTDPHYSPLPFFDNASGRWGSRSSFAFMEQGDFILYRNSERNFEVHTRLWSCGGSATCNCGVVLRDHNDVIEFTCCNQDLVYSDVTPLIAKLRSKKRLAPGILITQTIPGSNSQYLVTFPSGVKAKITRHALGIDVLLQTTRARHFANESGLCVSSNPRNGNQFRIKTGQSYFDTLPPPVLDTAVDCKVPCACYRKGEAGRTECQRELPVHFPNIMDQGGTPVILTGENNVDGRRKRSIKYTDDLTDEDFELFKLHAGSKRSNRHKRASPPKAKFSKENATQYCTKRLSDTEIGKLCANLGANLQELVDSCAVDLELTGETAFAISVASLLMNECGEIAGRNLSYYLNASNEEKPEVPSYLTNIIKKLCPNDCTFNGRCVNGSCICNEGYTANDCAIPIYQIPQISMLQGNGLCDRRQRPCRKVTVMGTGFVNSTNMTCHITKFKVVNSSWTPNNTEIRLPGTMTDLALTECRLPELPVTPGHYHEKIGGTPAAGLMISLSNDGEHKSAKNVTFISYDSACLSCNVSTGCVLKGNSCLINRYCFAPNETNPNDLCYQCLPDISKSRWTKRQVNLPPRFAISTQHFALFEELLELVIEVFDPEGMPVNVSLANGSPIEAEMRDNVLIWNVTNNAKTHFFLRATDICQATSSSNITVSLVECPCRNGSCVPHPNKPRGSGLYACDCVPGFTGDKCETNIDDCRSYPCIRGRCIDGINNFTCICDAGYGGKTCDIDYDDCGSSPCVHGNCSDFTGAYRCSCEPGYGGQNCNIDINECQSSPCMHGRCIDGINNFTCICNPGYVGRTCDDYDDCSPFPCVHGRCIDSVNNFSCICDAGYVGRTCDIDCSSSHCVHVVPDVSTVPSKPTTELVQEGIATDFELVLRVYKEWDDRFRVETSDQFKSLAGVLKNEMLKIYSRVPKFKNVTIISMRPDELLVVEFKLTFKTKVTVKDALAPLKKKVSSGQLGSLKVDPNSLKLKINSQEKESSEPQHATKLPIVIGVSCAAFVLIAIPTLCAVFKWNRSVKNALLPRSNSRVGSGSAMPQEMVFRKVDYKSQQTRVKKQKFSLHEKIQLSEVNNGIDF
ncbi:unnamed protein product [Porites lobata]|uniref:Sushi, nidogen and EGF-like domain-containing protein 1 n=1 Tax=Porites lobata TaxID=104759 RepID=A0ABN8MVZ7_9CNID|nr:unnamed protein product [Porites lobata]